MRWLQLSVVQPRAKPHATGTYLCQPFEGGLRRHKLCHCSRALPEALEGTGRASRPLDCGTGRRRLRPLTQSSAGFRSTDPYGTRRCRAPRNALDECLP
ncbi:hypothetical protein VDGL01_11236 [Verticillium dahliae]